MRRVARPGDRVGAIIEPGCDIGVNRLRVRKCAELCRIRTRRSSPRRRDQLARRRGARSPNLNAVMIDVPAVLAFGGFAAGEAGHRLE